MILNKEKIQRLSACYGRLSEAYWFKIWESLWYAVVCFVFYAVAKNISHMAHERELLLLYQFWWSLYVLLSFLLLMLVVRAGLLMILAPLFHKENK